MEPWTPGVGSVHHVRRRRRRCANSTSRSHSNSNLRYGHRARQALADVGSCCGARPHRRLPPPMRPQSPPWEALRMQGARFSARCTIRTASGSWQAFLLPSRGCSSVSPHDGASSSRPRLLASVPARICTHVLYALCVCLLGIIPCTLPNTLTHVQILSSSCATRATSRSVALPSTSLHASHLYTHTYRHTRPCIISIYRLPHTSPHEQ